MFVMICHLITFIQRNNKSISKVYTVNNDIGKLIFVPWVKGMDWVSPGSRTTSSYYRYQSGSEKTIVNKTTCMYSTTL